MEALVQGSGKKQGMRGRGAQPVSDLVAKLLDPVIERRAGMSMDLIAAWPELVGKKHAIHSRPEKLDWPRRASDEEPFQPATLIVACEGTHALFMQHESATIIARINTYFGFAAVGRMRLLQKPVKTPAENRKPDLSLRKADREELDSMLGRIEDGELREALEKMGKGVFSDRSAAKR